MPKIKLHLQVLENVNQRSLVENIVQEFVQQVLSKKATFEKGIIHGDLNENNILMSKSEQGEWEVSAVLDFGDSHFSNYFFEVAISLCYAMLECKKANLDFLTGAGHVLAGYLNIHPTFVINYKLMKVFKK